MFGDGDVRKRKKLKGDSKDFSLRNWKDGVARIQMRKCRREVKSSVSDVLTLRYQLDSQMEMSTRRWIYQSGVQRRGMG